MTCLSIIQNVSQELGGFAQVNAAITSSDPQVLQLVALLNKEGKQLAKRPEEGWQVLNMEAQFTTVASEIQGNIYTIAPGLKYILNDTIYDYTQRRPVWGPLSVQQWQKQNALFALVPYNQYRIVNNQIHFLPVPSAGDDCHFEYQSKNWAMNQDGTTTSDSFLQDTDTSLLDEDLLALGLMWRWKAAKGLDYAEDFATYERSVETSIARDIPRNKLYLDNRRLTQPFPYVQEGSFPGP